MRIFDVQHPRIDLCPAASHRARGDVGEVVLQAAGEAVVDERRELLGERGRGVRTGDDQVDIGKRIVEAALTLSGEVREVVHSERRPGRNPIDLCDIHGLMVRNCLLA